MVLENKIDFKVVFAVKAANPNGDPLNGNRPRQTSDGYGEVSDVALKRKIRNRLQDMYHDGKIASDIFVQSADRADDGYKSLKDRAEGDDELKKAMKDKDAEAFAKIAEKKWIDVRSFGQVFAFKDMKNLSVGVRGPVSIQTARSITPVMINEMQITKSVNSVTSDKKSADTMGMKYSIDFAVYEFNGSINVQLAEKTGFTREDADAIHKALETLFENDESASRPAGSMEVLRVYWWEHDNKLGKHSSAAMHRSVKVQPKNGEIMNNVDDVEFIEEPFDDVKEDVFRG